MAERKDDTRSLKFDSLPIEVLSNIAGYTTASTALALSLTNHTLRTATWDPFVFRSVITHQQIIWHRPVTIGDSHQYYELIRHGHCTPFADNTLDIDAIALAAGSDPRNWLKFAIANEDANALVGGLDHDLKKGRIQWLLRWAPHLATYRHPFVTSPWLVENLLEVMIGEPIEADRAYLWVCCMSALTQEGLDRLGSASKKIQPGRTGFLRAWRPGKSLPKAFRALGHFNLELKQLIKQKSYAAAFDSHLNPKMPPPGMSIPLYLPNRPPTQATASLPKTPQFNLPIPFGSDWESSYDTLAESLCSRDFLASGKWAGYYAYRYSTSLEHPMVNIQFSFPSAKSTKFTATGGYDGVGPFTIEGQLCPEDGALKDCFKAYKPGPRWEWKVRVGPFGIWGVWGHEGANAEGALWLWKDEWCQDRERLEGILDQAKHGWANVV